jgi:AmmeMemoRadiSam system protein B
MIRHPIVAGRFYSKNPCRLGSELDSLLAGSEPGPAEKVLGIIAPHAGYIYSGMVAGAVYSKIEIPDAVIILGPNHTGVGSRAALYPRGEWVTPLGRAEINSSLSGLIRAKSPMVEEDASAHQNEHSIEVHLPFLQHLNPNVTIVPLCLGFYDFTSCRSLGVALAHSIKEYGSRVLIVASSDMSHYESAVSATRKDEMALGEVFELNPEGLLAVCRREAVSMCGVIPVAVMMVAALELGATKVKLVKYATSGDVTGDSEEVVGYAALSVS